MNLRPPILLFSLPPQPAPSTSCLLQPTLLRSAMAISSTPTPPPRPLGRRTFRGTSPPPADAGSRLFRLQILRASKPSRSFKLDPRTSETVSSNDIRRVYAPTPVVPRTVDAAKGKPLVSLDATRDSAHHHLSQHHLQPTSGHSRDDARARSPVVLPKREPDEDRVWFPPRPLAAMAIARRRRLGDNGFPPPFASKSGGDVSTINSTAQALNAIRSQPLFLHDSSGHTTYRVISRHRFTWYTRQSRGDSRSYSPEVPIKSEPEEDLTPLAARLPNVGSTFQLPLSDTAIRPHTSEPSLTPEHKEIRHLPQADPSFEHGGIVSQNDNPEIPLLVVSRRETLNKGNTEAPTASINHPRVPSLSTVTQHASTIDSFSAMFPWARYSVELNRPTNIPCVPPPAAVNRESTPVLVTDEEYFSTTEEVSESERESVRESAESDRGSKRTWSEASDGDGESAEDEVVEEQRPLRRRKLMWVD